MASTPGTNITNRFGDVQGFADFEFGGLIDDIVGIEELNYSSEVEMENVYGRGRMPVGVGVGNYKATASASILWEEWLAILARIPAGKTYHDLQGNIPVIYDHENVAMADTIHNVRIKKADKGLSQGSKKTVVKLELHCSHIDEGVNV